MSINLPAGKYVVAVSGGVDSVVLLHLLMRHPELQLTVAHYDHGIRPNSADDRRHVQALARYYRLPFVYHEGHLGPGTSEAKAREVRYKFLHGVRKASRAEAIITAHHQDDLLETAILNMLRGTARRGLSSLKSTDVVKRPLLQVPKKELLRFAKEEGLIWREDDTNADTKYLRNHIRHNILPRFAESDRARLIDIVKRSHDLNHEIEHQVAHYLHLQSDTGQLDRHEFIMLPHIVARDVMATWLRLQTNAELSRKMLERLVVAAKTGKAGSKTDIDAEHWLYISPARLALRPRDC